MTLTLRFLLDTRIMGKMKDTGLRTLFGSYCSVVLSDNDRIVYKTPPQGTADSKVAVLSRSHGII